MSKAQYIYGKLKRCCDFGLRIVRHRVFAFILIAFFMSLAFSIQGKQVERRAHREIERHAYEECQQSNRTDIILNNRMELFAQAHQLVEFMNKENHDQFMKIVDRAKRPVPLAKCHKPSL